MNDLASLIGANAAFIPTGDIAVSSTVMKG
jgi:hypothetical protein